MHRYRFCIFALLAMVLLSCLSGCARRHISHDIKYSVYGFDPDPMRRVTYIGAVSDLPARGAEVTVRTLHNTVYCKGMLSPAEPGKSPATGEGSLTCGDGRKLDVRWTALSAETGVAAGEFSDGRNLVFSYGFDSPAQSTAAIKGHFAEDAPDAGPEKPGPGDGGTPGAPKTPPKDTAEKPDWTGNGTGFFISGDGLLVTNYHVVEGAVRVGVEDTIARKEYPAEVIVVDKENDLAIVKIEARTRALPIGDSKAVRKGQEVVAMGYPMMDVLGKEQKATFGRVNSLSGFRGDVRLLQTDAAIQGGNSGGPLVNMNGEVIGINSYGLDTAASLRKTGQIVTNDNYAVKSDYLKVLLASLPKQYAVANRGGARAANMAELVRRCEPSVVIVWSKTKKTSSRRPRAFRPGRF